jgi:hypothetical protein
MKTFVLIYAAVVWVTDWHFGTYKYLIKIYIL